MEELGIPFSEKVKQDLQGTTLVIHPQDTSTDSLKRVYAGITDKIVIRAHLDDASG